MNAVILENPKFSQQPDPVYNERTAVEPLRQGKTVRVQGRGNSMVPLLHSGDIVTIVPHLPVHKGDIVLAKVKGRVYLHKVGGIKETAKGPIFKIENNKGHVNGWTQEIYGVMLNGKP